jgi:uncharacterized protein
MMPRLQWLTSVPSERSIGLWIRELAKSLPLSCYIFDLPSGYILESHVICFLVCMRKIIAYAASALLALMIPIMLWGVLIEPGLIDQPEWTVEIPGLPASWNGREIALMADLQIGMWLGNTDTVRRIVDRLIQRKPAAVLIAGDFIYHPTEDEPEEVREEFEPSDYREDALEQIRQAVDLIRPLTEAGIRVYAVLGNHDYGMETESAVALPWVADLVANSLSKIGVQLLDNRAVLIEPPGAAAAGDRSPDLPFYLVGIGAHLPRHDDQKSALAEVPAAAARVVFMHNPASFERIPSGQAPLALAAHTHGGQVRLPFLPEWTWLSYVKGEKIHADGWIDGYGRPGNRLYVNRGIGFSKVPIRINCRPELTIFTLRSQS